MKSCSSYTYFRGFIVLADVVALKNSVFNVNDSRVTQIYNKALLCNGDEESLLECVEYEGEEAGSRCSNDHSEDAGVICNGMLQFSP